MPTVCGVTKDKKPAICILGCHWHECESCNYEVTHLAVEDERVWLPRQDQLQEMMSDELLGLQTVCAVIYEFAVSAGETSGITIDGSMEQLWLAFVMHEKYQKIWDEKATMWGVDWDNKQIKPKGGGTNEQLKIV